MHTLNIKQCFENRQKYTSYLLVLPTILNCEYVLLFFSIQNIEIYPLKNYQYLRTFVKKRYHFTYAASNVKKNRLLHDFFYLCFHPSKLLSHFSWYFFKKSHIILPTFIDVRLNTSSGSYRNKSLLKLSEKPQHLVLLSWHISFYSCLFYSFFEPLKFQDKSFSIMGKSKFKVPSYLENCTTRK